MNCNLFFRRVIRRITTLLSVQGSLLAQNEAALKQAASASTAARRLMDEADDKDKGSKSSKSEVTELQTKLKTLQDGTCSNL